jgi:hypothetical protein
VSPYVKKGGHGGHRSGAGRKTSLTELQRLRAVERFRAEREKERNKAETKRPAKRVQANWLKLAKVPIKYRERVLQLAEKDELPDNVPPAIRRAVRVLKKNRLLVRQTRGKARPYKKREETLRSVAKEVSQKYGVEISWQQLRHWSACDAYEKLREKLFPRKT